MPTHELRRDEWVAFFEAFTTENAGHLVSFGVDSTEPKYEAIGAKVHQLPLREIAADIKDKESAIVISVGLSEDRLMRHSIQPVAHIRVTQTENGPVSTIDFEAVSGTVTTLSLD